MERDSASLVLMTRKEGSVFGQTEEPALLILSTSPIHLEKIVKWSYQKVPNMKLPGGATPWRPGREIGDVGTSRQWIALDMLNLVSV